MAQVDPQLLPAAFAADAAAALPAIQEPTITYGARFAKMGDLYEGAYAPLLEAHDPTAQHTPASVLQTALALAANSDFPGVYAYQAPGTFEIRTVHRLSRTNILPGRATPWDGVTFAFSGDVVPPGAITTVQLPAQAFHLTAAAIVPTATTMSERWAAQDAAVQCLGPFLADDADVTAVVIRRFTPVPYAYVQYLHNRVLTPRQAWQVAEQVVADGRAADCEIFVNFLRAACTYRIPAAAEVAVSAAAALPAPLVVPLADEHLLRQIGSWLVGDLPALAVSAPGSVEQQYVATTAVVRQEFALARANAEAARADAKAPKTVTEAFPTMAHELRLLCSVDSDEALPTFWREFATAGGKKQHALPCLQQLVSRRAKDPYSAQSPIVVSVALFERVAQFRLGAPDTDDLEEGLSPFLICPQHYHLAAGTRLECNTYGMLTSGSGAPTLADLHDLTAPKLKSPRDALELTSFVGGYSCLLDVLLGEDHGAAARLRNHASFWRQNAPALASMVGSEHLSGFLMRIMRTLQLITVEYINEALQYGAEAALPDYGRIQDAVRHRTWQNLSLMPPHYLEAKATPLPKPVVQPSSLAMAAGLTPTPSTTAAPTAAQPNATKAVRVDAPKAQQNSDWAAKFAASSKDIRVLKAEDGRPKICFSYHLRGTCFEGCREHATHRALTATERTTFQAFLDKAL